MKQMDWDKLHRAQTMIEECIAAADLNEARRIYQILDDLKCSAGDGLLGVIDFDGDH